MTVLGSAALVVLLLSPPASAFVVEHRRGRVPFAPATSLRAADGPVEDAKRAAAGFLAAAALWSSPSLLSSLPVAEVLGSTGGTAYAKEMASGSGSRVNKDAESLLRYGLPINNKEVRKLQAALETVRQDIVSKRTGAAQDGSKISRGMLKSKVAEMTKSCVDPKACADIIAKMSEDLTPLDAALDEAKNFQLGSQQQGTALDKAAVAQAVLSKQLTTLEEGMVPKGYTTPVPEQYKDLPQLQGRATVEFVIKKTDGAPFDIQGVNFPEARLKMVIDGYNAPVTAGNFVDLVLKNFYTEMNIQRSDGFVVQTGDPKGEADGYVGTPSKSIGRGRHGERLIPLEIFVKGDKGPFYETTIEDDGRGGQATTLPFSSYGVMGWAREEYDPNSGSSQFFWLLFDSDLTPAGKNVLDGRYPVFGYVVEGADYLADVKEGDVIVSAKVLQGAENLLQPSSP